ncbi:ras and EF-hand domain-containing protein [Corythoichthys intestinalis]|uniref:ras and EF-hand domain-containing protein n=1 Tax=Corythoichthys intestinalis TaxID=161448 RepID=UPI0025A562A2|nr:ras and EF-hand domain-containing protein [Corythoichthys intestinalis]XP_057692221.1 ras and EF-hand domain-containing protein [Corythoichthys intestinalis]
MEPNHLQNLFCICDINQSGKIEFEDFTVVCRELNVPDSEVQTLFGKFGVDDEGCIDFGRFSCRFKEVFQTMGPDFSTVGSGMSFAARFDIDDGVLSESLKEQLADLYQAIHACANASLLQQYEQVVRSVVSQSLDIRLECYQLEASLRRVEDMNSSQLSELEDDMQRQLAGTEERARAEERKKMEEVMCNMQRKHENRIADMQVTVDRLLQSQEESQVGRFKEEELKVTKRIGELSQENEFLRSSLREAQTSISVLHSELDKLKNMYADERAQHERETNQLKKMVIEYETSASHIEILQERNKELYDSNEILRATLETETKRKLPLNDEVPAQRKKPIRQSTQKSLSIESEKSTMSEVSSWAEKYLDSGVSLPLDSSASDFDMETDDGRDSTETVHISYSDHEFLDAKSEAGLSLCQSFASSNASAFRKLLPAFNNENGGEDVCDMDDTAPIYSLVLAGDSGAGKSSFLHRLAFNQFRDDIQTTLGVDFQMKKMIVDGQMTNLRIWDTAGQERFRSIARSYFRKAEGVLLLYDVTSEPSFLSIRDWLDQIRDSADEKIPVCIIGNKVDKREHTPAKRCVSTSHGEKLATAYGALFCETSAKEGTNVVEAVLHLAREVKKNVKVVKPKTSPVELAADSAKKTFGTCCRL